MTTNGHDNPNATTRRRRASRTPPEGRRDAGATFGSKGCRKGGRLVADPPGRENGCPDRERDRPAGEYPTTARLSRAVGATVQAARPA